MAKSKKAKTELNLCDYSLVKITKFFVFRAIIHKLASKFNRYRYDVI